LALPSLSHTENIRHSLAAVDRDSLTHPAELELKAVNTRGIELEYSAGRLSVVELDVSSPLTSRPKGVLAFDSLENS
jgi:hypothetical protein